MATNNGRRWWCPGIIWVNWIIAEEDGNIYELEIKAGNELELVQQPHAGKLQSSFSSSWDFYEKASPLIRPSVRLSVRTSVHASVHFVRPSVRPSFRRPVGRSIGNVFLDAKKEEISS